MTAAQRHNVKAQVDLAARQRIGPIQDAKCLDYALDRTIAKHFYGTTVPAKRRDYHNRTGGRQRGSSQTVTDIRAPRSGRRYWTPERIVSSMQRWSDEHGSPPSCKKWAKSGAYWPRHTTVINRMGTWNTAIEAAGLPARKQQGGKQRRREQRRAA